MQFDKLGATTKTYPTGFTGLTGCLVSATDHFVGQVFFLHRIAVLAAGDGLLPVRLPAGRQNPVHPVNPV